MYGKNTQKFDEISSNLRSYDVLKKLDSYTPQSKDLVMNTNSRRGKSNEREQEKVGRGQSRS